MGLRPVAGAGPGPPPCGEARPRPAAGPAAGSPRTGEAGRWRGTVGLPGPSAGRSAAPRPLPPRQWDGARPLPGGPGAGRWLRRFLGYLARARGASPPREATRCRRLGPAGLWGGERTSCRDAHASAWAREPGSRTSSVQQRETCRPAQPSAPFIHTERVGLWSVSDCGGTSCLGWSLGATRALAAVQLVLA